MKTLKILVLVSILAVTQSFAFSKTQRNVLLGIGAGAIIIHALESHNNNRYETSDTKVVYVNSHNSYKKHAKKRHIRKHNRHDNHHYSSRHNRHHNKHYRRNHHRYDSIAFNTNHRRSYNRY